MTFTRHDAMFYGCAIVAWVVIGSIALWQIVSLGCIFALMFALGEAKEARRVRRIIEDAAV